MKLLLPSAQALFESLSDEMKTVYWDTILTTSYTDNIPFTRYAIRLTATVKLPHQWTLAQVTLRCGGHCGEAHEEFDPRQKQKVHQYKSQLQTEIQTLADRFDVQLRDGILTNDPTEHLYGVITRKTMEDKL